MNPLETMVCMHDGAEKRLEDIRVGSRVRTPSGDPARVAAVVKDSSSSSSGDQISITTKHGSLISLAADLEFLVVNKSGDAEWTSLSSGGPGYDRRIACRRSAVDPKTPLVGMEPTMIYMNGCGGGGGKRLRLDGPAAAAGVGYLVRQREVPLWLNVR